MSNLISEVEQWTGGTGVKSSPANFFSDTISVVTAFFTF